MYKKIIILLLTFILLVPSTAFANETPIDNEEQKSNPSEDYVETPTETSEPTQEPSTNKEDGSETPIDTHEDETPGEPKESIITNATIKSSSPNSCVLSWDAIDATVKINISYNDEVKEVEIQDNNTYTLKDIPFGAKVTAVLTTDEEHTPVTLECNPSEDYKPESIEGNRTVEFCGPKQTGIGYYYLNLKITTHNGTQLKKSDYSLESGPITSSGKYNVKVIFNGDYAQYEPLETTLTVYPTQPHVSFSTYFAYETHIYFSACNYDEQCDYMIAEISTNSNFKNPIVRKAKTTRGKYTQFKVTGLKRNTQYFVRVRAQKIYNKESIYSPYAIIKLHTAVAAPVYSWKQNDVRNIVNLASKNRTFSYTFRGNYDIQKMYDFLGNIDEDFPQYTRRYTRSSSWDDGKFTVTYTPNKKTMAKYTKATKAINSIVKGAKKKKSVRAKVKYINKRLCKTCSYDYTSYRNRRRGKPVNSDTYSFYGCLVRHKAVCAGYSEAFKLIAVQCGIPNTYGCSPNHRWNKVKIGERWYHVDVTWNDCTHSNRYLLKKSHK